MGDTGSRRGRRTAGLMGCLLAALVLVAACGSGGGGSTAPGKATDTVTWAEPPATTPNYLWPFVPAADFSVANVQLQKMLWRPLYFFGASGTVTLTPQLSIGQEPSYSADGRTLTITLKSTYTWSDGQPITADDVLFWINLARAEKANYGNYTPGLFPDNVVSATAPNPQTVVLTTDQAYSHTWFLYDQLSQITPLPTAWDVSGPGVKSDCDTDVSACPGVYAYMAAQAKAESTYSSNPLWQVVDGPWRLKSFSSDGAVSLVPNPKYTGPHKPSLKQFNMAPFTTDSAEFNVLKSGKTLDVGYIPTQDLSSPRPQGSSPLTAGPNPLSGYTMVPWVLYGFNYFPINFDNPSLGPLFKQLYFRQAVQSIINQPAILSAAAKNYGTPTNGPVPTFPTNPAAPVSTDERSNPYPFSIQAARGYLERNGWTVRPNGESTCGRAGSGAGQCGAGVSAGQRLNFSMLYASGVSTVTTAMESLKSNAAQIGMQITIRAQPFDQVISVAAAPCSGPTCTWQLANWGGGWVYGVDPLPTGENLFQTGAVNNSGGYSDPAVDALIRQTLTSNDTAAFTAYENALAKNLPVIWQPDYTYQLSEVAGGLNGVSPNSPLSMLTPETWHY